MRRQIISILAGAAVLASAVYGGMAVYDTLRTPVPVGTQSVPAKIAPAVKKAPKKKVTVKAPVDVYTGPAAANLKLPPLAPAEEVLTAAQVPGSLRPQTVTTTINTETGATQTFVKSDPYPWFAIEARGEIKAAYGYKTGAGSHVPVAVGRLQLNYDVLRLKALTVGATGTLDSDRQAFAGIAISYKW